MSIIKRFFINLKVFLKIFDAFDFTVLCQVNASDALESNTGQSNSTDEPIVFINGFFLDIETVIVTTSHGYACLYALPEM